MIIGALLLAVYAFHPAAITKAGGDENTNTKEAEEHTLTIRTDLPRRAAAPELTIRPTVAHFSLLLVFQKTGFQCGTFTPWGGLAGRQDKNPRRPTTPDAELSCRIPSFSLAGGHSYLGG